MRFTNLQASASFAHANSRYFSPAVVDAYNFCIKQSLLLISSPNPVCVTFPSFPFLQATPSPASSSAVADLLFLTTTTLTALTVAFLTFTATTLTLVSTFPEAPFIPTALLIVSVTHLTLFALVSTILHVFSAQVILVALSIIV